MSIVSDYPDNSPHVAVAAQLAAGGVPLIGKPALLKSDVGRAILGGGSFTETAANVSQIGYSGYVSAEFPAAATIPFVQVTFEWNSSALGIQVQTDTYVIPGNTSGGGFVVYVNGPTKADELFISFKNLDPAQTATVSVGVVQDSIVRYRDDWRWANAINNGTTVPAWTLPTLPNDEKSLGMINSAIAASTSLQLLFGMHDGPIGVGFQAITVAASALSIFFQAVPSTVYQGNNPLGNYLPTAPGVFEIAGTRSPIRVTITNTSTVAGTVAMALTAKN